MQRVFLGWNTHCLPKAAEWLSERYTHAGCLDLGSVVVATPGARAGRRLLELLVDQTPDTPLVPPKIVTTGRLPEQLYTSDLPVADSLRSLLARVLSLRSAEGDLLAQVVPHPPEQNDFAGWLALGRELNRLHDELAGEAISFKGALDRSALLPDFPEQQRWEALVELQGAYEQTLAQQGLVDLHAARAAAIRQQSCRTDADIVLVAAVDLNRTTQMMLEQVTDRVTALIHAPPEEADRFDATGCINVDQWVKRKLNLDRANLSVVDRPINQAYEVLRTVSHEQSTGHADLTADDITIGLGDEKMGPAIQRTLGLAQLPTRLAAGRSLSYCPPAMLLAALARFVNGRRFDDFAALVRHPDIEHYIRQQDADALATAVAGVDLTALDRCRSEHLQERVAQRLPGSDEKVSNRLDHMFASVSALLAQDAGKSKPLPDWCEPTATILQHVYEKRKLSRHDPDQTELIQGLEAIAELLGEHAELGRDEPITPEVTLAEAIQLLLSQLAERSITPEGGRSAIELLGWLELQLDDAPVLIVTGVNEGLVPQSINSDPFLPDHFRSVLGLADNRRRYARDLMMLEAIRHSRRAVRLISGRRSGDNNPLMPSRLTMACDDDRLPEWVNTFYQGDNHDDVRPPSLLEPGTTSRFVIPIPEPPDGPITSLSVTAFAKYLACPYRFYLNYVLKLHTIDDKAVELDGATFGSLAHRVLKAFGEADVRDSKDHKQIHAFLSDRLDALVGKTFGDKPRTAVLLQRELLRRRFEAFAVWQANECQEGWRINPKWVEAKASAELTVDGQPLSVVGRIDRIDRHQELGYRIIDYKTGDNAKTPQNTHQAGPKDDKEWIDLQLPLYETLAGTLGVVGRIELGYVNVPKDLIKAGLAPADWTGEQIADAHDKAHEIIRQIRNGVFWPPGNPPMYDDGLAGICMDHCTDRTEVIDAQMKVIEKAGDA